MDHVMLGRDGSSQQLVLFKKKCNEALKLGDLLARGYAPLRERIVVRIVNERELPHSLTPE